MMPIAVPIVTDSKVARNAISSDTRAPYTTRAKMSRPFSGSTPIGWSQHIPPNLPIGASVPVLVSIRSWLYRFGDTPMALQISGAKIATSISTITTPAPASATLSRLSLVQAIWPSERPSILPAPLRTASGSAAIAPGSTSSGVVTRRVPLPVSMDPGSGYRVAAALTCRHYSPESNAQSAALPDRDA